MKWISQHIWDFISRFRNDVYIEGLAEVENEFSVMVDTDGKLTKSTHPGERSRVQVRNDEGATIPTGAPLYSKGEIGGSERILVGICDSSDTAKMPCIGVAEFEMNTTTTKDSFAVTQGVYNTNISGFTGLSVGNVLYVNSGSAPYLTQTKPTTSNLIQNVGIVLKTNGTICQGLLVSAIGRTNDVPTPIYVDHANQRVGIGTSSPSHKLTISSSNNTTAVGIDIGSSANFDFAANSSSGYSTLFYMDDVGLDIGHNSTARAINFKTGSADRLTITGGGNVLIGTTTDDGSKLRVEGNTNVYGDLKITSTMPSLYFADLQQDDWRLMNDNGDFRFTNIDGTGHAIIINTNNNITLAGSLAGTSANFSGQVTIPATPVASTDAASKSYVDAQVGASDTLQEVTDNGNTTTNSIMIGSSSSPSASLHVVGQYIQLERSGTMGIQFGNSSNLNAGRILYSSSSSNNFMSFYTNDSEKMRVTSGGNVLIGTTTDNGDKLQVDGTATFNSGTTNTVATFISSDSGAGIKLTDNTGSSTIQTTGAQLRIGVDEDGAVANSTIGFRVDGSTKMTLTSDGNLALGGSSPASKLDIHQGGITLDTDWPIKFGPNAQIEGNTSGTKIRFDATAGFNWTDGGTTNMQLLDNGNLLIGTTTDSGHKLQVNGDIKINDGDILRIGDSSDLKLYHTGTGTVIQNAVGNLTIQQDQNSGDIIFRCDDGSGGTTPYITLDGSQTTINLQQSVLIGTTTNSGVYKLDVFGKARVQSVFELDDVLTLNQISTPADPASGKSSIYMDSADGAIKCKINVGGTVVTRTIASFE